MEKDSSELSMLSLQNSMPTSRPRRRWRKRDENIVENTQPYKPKIKRYPIPGEDTTVPSTSRGEKRRNTEDEDEGQNVKRLMTQHTNQSDGDGLHHDKSSHIKLMITVNLAQRCDVTDGGELLQKSTHTNDSFLERSEKRKSEFDRYSQKGTKRLKVSSEEYNESDQHTSDDGIGYVPCKNTCVCKVGPTQKPRPIERRGNQKVAPLYKKVLQRRMLNTINVFMNDCCDRQCCDLWVCRRYSNQCFEDAFDSSNLRVDYFSWGVWKQKPEIQKSNNNNTDDDDDDWFW